MNEIKWNEPFHTEEEEKKEEEEEEEEEEEKEDFLLQAYYMKAVVSFLITMTVIRHTDANKIRCFNS